ncbi:MAG TPA: ATP-binding protein [bacterium]|nr:ATP-binding protein [bacterium]
MKRTFRPLPLLFLVSLLVALFFLALVHLSWIGAGVLFAGLALGAGLTLYFTLAPEGQKPPQGPQGQPATVSPVERANRDDRDVYIPGRNFEEILQRLGAHESMLDVVLNSMGEGVMLLNQADRLVLMNPSAEKILATTEKDGMGKHYLEVVRHPSLADLLTRSKKEGGMASGEIDLSGKEEKTFAVSAASIRTEREQHLGQIVVFSDITSLKRLMRMRTEFVANVSHELKTPLTAILGYVETLLEGAIDDKKNRGQFLQKISDQAQRLHALITDVLELSKIESGAFITSLEAVDAAEAAQQAVDILKAKWEAKGILIRQEIKGGEKAQAHREGLFHVFENLLDNAVKYSPPKSEIRIYSAQTGDGRLEFTVEDHGPGIPKEAQGRVFERFFRVDAARNREAGGTGLGLAIVKHLVEKMNGEVSLRSEAGKGSSFSVILPPAA